MSTRPFLLTLLISATALHAEETAAVKAEAPAEPYQLKNRSSFTCTSEEVRAPFWPIGWVHRKGVSSAVQTEAEAPKLATLDERSFRLTSVLLGSGSTPSLAVINGRAYSEGEFLKMPRPSAAPVAAGTGKPATPAVARIRVQRINDGNVILQRDREMVTVSMQRQELITKKVEEPLLDEDR